MTTAEPSGAVSLAVVVLHDDVADDAPPDELDILEEVAAVEEALRKAGHRVRRLALGLDLTEPRRALVADPPDLVFNLVEGHDGNGRLALLGPLLLGSLGLPYTGTGLEGMAISASKLLAKRALAAAGLPTPPWITSAGAASDDVWRGAWMVKPVWEHASIGIEDDAIVPLEKVPETLAKRADDLGGEWFAEGFVDGREINLALLAGAHGFETLPPAEIRFDEFPDDKPRIVNYAAKWDATSFEYRHALRSFDFGPEDATLLSELRELALECAAACSLAGYARVDVRVDDEGRAWIIDVNANPCVSPDAGFVANAAEAGLSYAEVMARILTAGRRQARRRRSPRAADR